MVTLTTMPSAKPNTAPSPMAAPTPIWAGLCSVCQRGDAPSQLRTWCPWHSTRGAGYPTARGGTKVARRPRGWGSSTPAPGPMQTHQRSSPRRSRRTIPACAGGLHADAAFSGAKRGSARGAPARPGRRSRSEPQPCGGGHHRRPARMHGRDDLLGIDPLQVDAGRAEVRVPELALDDVQRHALTSELEGVRVTQLVRGEPTPDPARTASRLNSERTAHLTTVARGWGRR